MHFTTFALYSSEIISADPQTETLLIMLLKVTEPKILNFQQHFGKTLLKKPQEIHNHFKKQCNTLVDLDKQRNS